MIAPNRLTPMGNGLRGWRCEKHDLASTVAGWTCPRCRVLKTVDVLTRPAPVVARPRAGRRNVCTLGHAHDSHGEAVACPRVYASAAHAGLTTFRPGRPGIPCFRVAADDNGRPVYCSVDWVLVDASGKPAAVLDWKGPVSHNAMYGRSDGFARTKRIIESELGVPVRELVTLDDIEQAIAASRGGGGGNA